MGQGSDRACTAQNQRKGYHQHLTAEQLEQKFLEMFAIYFADRKATIDILRYVQKR